MLKVGLTGSIAVGKTYVCDVLRELGAVVLDADVTAREVVEPGTPGLREIVKVFGPDVLDDAGRLDRRRVADIVFADEHLRRKLNSIVHPLVIESQNEWLIEQERRDPNSIAVIDAALMIESGSYKRFDQLIVVWCEPEIQLERLMSRDGLSREEAQQRIASQMSQDEKKRYAHHLIDTSNGFDDTRRQVAAVYRRLEGMAVKDLPARERSSRE